MSSADKLVFYQSDLPLASFNTFNEMRSKGDLCDVTFRIENLRITAHRLVLAANVPYFRAMFLSNMAESHQAEIDFEGIDFETFESLLNFAYGLKIEICLDNVLSLIVGASFLQMDQVCDACCEFLSAKIDLGNVLDLREFASAHGVCKLQESTDEYLQNHFVEISKKEKFFDLPFPYFKELISKDRLCVTSEEEVFEVVMSWVKKLVVERQDKLPELLRLVRMPLISYRFLSTHAGSEELIQNSVSCQELLEEAKDYRILREKRSDPCSFVTRPRRLLKTDDCENCLYVVCRREEGFPYIFVERLDLKVKRWTTMESKTMFVEDTTVAVMGNKIYVIGGCDRQGRVLDIVQVFDVESDSWSTAAVLKAPKRLVAAAAQNNTLYACGGQTETTVTRDVQCYNCTRNEWLELPPMLQYRSAACAAFCDKFLYVLGGYGGDCSTSNYKLSSVEIYDPEIRQWSLISEIGFVPYRFGIASMKGKIYVDGENGIEVYDPLTRRWNKIFKEDSVSASLLALDSKLALISEDGRICFYKIEEKVWSDEKRRVPGKVHVIGVARGSKES